MTTVVAADILLPKGIDLQKWATVACDQFTSEPKYWDKLSAMVGDSPSALKITFPEVYLKQGTEPRTTNINRTMEEYLKQGLFQQKHGFVLVEREVEHGKCRLGLVVAVDLEKYDWNRVKVDIRATESTIAERLPVRVKIREHAPLELPHILLLIDDKKKSIIEPLYARRAELEKLYDFDLNMQGGHIRGYFVPNTAPMIAQFEALKNTERQMELYGEDAGIMLAVGDGNHSLATAKVHWENLKKTLTAEECATHPARFALAEVVNLYDDAMLFEPIHRVAIGKSQQVLAALKAGLSGAGSICIIFGGKKFLLPAPEDSGKKIAAVEQILMQLKADGVEIDYIHGDKNLEEVVSATDGVGIFCPRFEKERLVPYVIQVGNLPKKAFSIGGAEFKKYYLEARKIIR